jgi:hypothetical protein
MKTRCSRGVCSAMLGLFAVFVLQLAQAQPVPKPAGPVVLTVSGAVSAPNEGDKVVFDAATLDAMPQRTLKTRTPWYPHAAEFSGPLLQDVLKRAGAKGSVLRITALNDYGVNVPFSDAADHGAILARRLDGKVLSIREKGPLFLIYPFDDKPELKRDEVYSRAIWQINRIVVK